MRAIRDRHRRVVLAAALVLGAGAGPHRLAAQPASTRSGTTAPEQPTARTRAGRLASSAARSLGAAAEARQARRATSRFDPLFQKYTRRYFGVGTDWRWFKAQGMAESDLTPSARSRVGARGIMQLMPSTYRHIQSALPHFGPIDDPEWNIAAGILHDRDLWRRWSRDIPEAARWDFTFAAYNAGEGTILRARKAAAARQLNPADWEAVAHIAPTVGRWRYRETLAYVRQIRANKAALPAR